MSDESEARPLFILFLADAAKVVKKIVKGILYIHSKQIAHRDLKFENILYER